MRYALLLTVGAVLTSCAGDAVSARSNEKCDKLTGRARSRCLMEERENRRNDGAPSQTSTRPATSSAVSSPGVPRNSSPGASSSPGATVSGSRVTISWSSVSGATEYDLGIRDIETNQLLVDTKTAATSYTARIEKGRVYRWNVRACNSAGCSAFTTPLYFQTESAVTSGEHAQLPVSAISIPASFPLYNQHDADDSQLYISSDWATAADPAGGLRTSYTCLATVYAMIEHARGNSRFKIGPETWSDQKGALGIGGIGASTAIRNAEELLSQFRVGNPVILWGPLPKNNFGHFVLAIGTNSAGQIIVLDPSGGKEVTVNPVTWRVSGGSVLSHVEKFRSVRF